MLPVVLHNYAPKLTAKTERPKFIFPFAAPTPIYPTTRLISNTPANPTSETIVSITDHDRIVSFIDKMKYSLNIQNPLSLTWEKKRLHAPTDSTKRY